MTPRHALLAQPHMRALAAYAARLRDQGRGAVPDMDPLDGGAGARLLVLLEKPGPGAVPPGGSGFVSRDNPDPTARTCRAALAGIPRAGVVIWNAVPWWNGTMALRAGERRDGLAELAGLLALLPGLRAAILAGREAQGAAEVLAVAGVPVFPSVHPSPQARAGPASAAGWQRIPEVWAAAWGLAAAPSPSGRGLG